MQISSHRNYVYVNIPIWFTRRQTVTHPSTNPAAHGRESNSRLVDHKSDALTTTLPSYRTKAKERETWAGLMVSDGEIELPAGDDAPFLTADLSPQDLSDAIVASDEDDEDDILSSSVPQDRRRPAWPFCPAGGDPPSTGLTRSVPGEVAMALSSSRAPRRTSSQPSKSLLGAVDGAWWPADRGGVGPVVVLVVVVETSEATDSKSVSRLLS